MTEQEAAPWSFEIIVANPDWSPTKIVVADAYVVGDEVRIQPREGLYVQDEDGLKAAIKRVERQFQAKGQSMREVCDIPASAPVDEKSRINAWRYLIVPKAEPEV